jgi:hypothetical protein
LPDRLFDLARWRGCTIARARPAGAVKSAAAIAIEIMILPNIDLRIAQVRPRVEGKRSAAFKVASDMLIVIMENSENHL